MSDSWNERRKEQRLYFDPKTDLSAELDSEKLINSVVVKPINISVGGFAFFYRGSIQIEVNDLVSIKMKWPKHKIDLKLSASVVWKSMDKTGIMFMSLMPEDEKALDNLMIKKHKKKLNLTHLN